MCETQYEYGFWVSNWITVKCSTVMWGYHVKPVFFLTCLKLPVKSYFSQAGGVPLTHITWEQICLMRTFGQQFIP